MIPIQTLRIKLDISRRSPLLDPQGQHYRLWRGNPAKIQVAVFRGNDVEELDNLAGITFEVDVTQTSTLPALMLQTVEAEDFGDPDESTWADGSAQHAEYVFEAGETNIDLCSKPTRECWLVIHALDEDGNRIILGYGILVIEEDNAGSGTPPGNPESYYTQAEADALFLKSAPDGATYRFGETHLELYNPTTETWHKVGLIGDPTQIEVGEAL